MANKEQSAVKAQQQAIPSDYPDLPKLSQGDDFGGSLGITLLVLAMVGLTMALGISRVADPLRLATSANVSRRLRPMTLGRSPIRNPTTTCPLWIRPACACCRCSKIVLACSPASTASNCQISSQLSADRIWSRSPCMLLSHLTRQASLSPL